MELVWPGKVRTVTLLESFLSRTGADVVIVKFYLSPIGILHDKAQAVMCLEGVFQSL